MNSPMRQGLWLVVVAALCLASQAGLSASDATAYALAESLALHGRIVARASMAEATAPTSADTPAIPPRPPRPLARPGGALLTVPFVWVGTLADDDAETDADAARGGFGAQIALGASAAAIAIAALLVFFTCVEFGCSRAGAWTATLVFAMTTVAWPMGGRLHDAVFATPVVLGCFHGWLRVRSGYDTRANRLALGVALGFAPLVHDVTLLLLPVFLLLVLAQGKHLWRPRFRWAPVAVPFALGLVVFALYNRAAFGGALTGPGGGDVVAEAWAARKLSPPIWEHVRALLVGAGSWRGILAAAALPPPQPFFLRDLGALVAAPHLAIGLLGFFPLRYEGMTRRPVFALVVVAMLWTLLVSAGAAPDQADALPLLALICVLVGSFVDYHLLSMEGLIIKPFFWLAFLYFCALGAANALAAVVARTLAAAPLEVVWDLFGKTPSVVPGMMDARSFGALVFPGLPNLPVTLPAAAVAFLATFALSFLLRDRGAVWLGPSPQTMRKINTPTGAAPRREPLATELRHGVAPRDPKGPREPEEPPVRVARPAPAAEPEPADDEWRTVYGGGADAQRNGRGNSED